MNPGPSRYVIFNPPCQSSGALSPISRLRRVEKEKLIDGAEDLTIQIHTLFSTSLRNHIFTFTFTFFTLQTDHKFRLKVLAYQ